MSGITNVPIPGQALTQDPASKLPDEKPPVHTEINELVGTLFDELTDKAILSDIVTVLKDGVKLDGLVSAYIEQGLIGGRWNSDMAHLLVEPLMFIFMWIASQVGAPVKFSKVNHFDSSGLDVLGAKAEQKASDAAVSLLAPEEV